MKKLLLGLGAIASVAAPVAAVVACGSTTEDKDTLTMKKADLMENFGENETDLNIAVNKLMADFITKDEDGVAKLQSIKSFKFDVEGIKGSFDFTTDKFLKGGNTEQVEFTDAAIADAKLKATIDAHFTGADTFGEQADYVATSQSDFEIDTVKGLTIKDATISAIEAKMTALENAQTKADAPDTAETAAETALDTAVNGVAKQLRFIIRMAIAAKTDLHYGFQPTQDEDGNQNWGWTFGSDLEK